MHGVDGKPPGAAKDSAALATSRMMLLLLVAMTGVAPISLYLLVPALPVLATIVRARYLDRADDRCRSTWSASPARRSSWGRCRIASDAARCCSAGLG